MRRADRLFHIVQILRRGKVVTAAHIADELEVSDRTVYRDLQDLSARGVPLRAETGVGYLLEKGFDIPPLMFNSAEVESLVIAARMLEAWADPQTSKQIKSALEKIEQVLPLPLRDKPARVRVFAPGFMTNPIIWQAMPELRKAIGEQRKFYFQYCDEKNQQSERTLRPLAVYFWGKAWTCVGWCELRQDFRHFRLDRMQNWMIMLDTFQDEQGKTLADFEERMREEKTCND